VLISSVIRLTVFIVAQRAFTRQSVESRPLLAPAAAD